MARTHSLPDMAITSMADQTAAVNKVYDAVEGQRLTTNLAVTVNLSNRVSVSARDVVEQTTTLRTLAGGIQQI